MFGHPTCCCHHAEYTIHKLILIAMQWQEIVFQEIKENLGSADVSLFDIDRLNFCQVTSVYVAYHAKKSKFYAYCSRCASSRYEQTPLQNHTAYCNVNVLSLNYIMDLVACSMGIGQKRKRTVGPGPGIFYLTILSQVQSSYAQCSYVSQNSLSSKSYAQSAYDSKFLLFKVLWLKVPTAQSSCAPSSYGFGVPTVAKLLVQSSYSCIVPNAKCSFSKFLRFKVPIGVQSSYGFNTLWVAEASLPSHLTPPH